MFKAELVFRKKWIINNHTIFKKKPDKFGKKVRRNFADLKFR